MKTFLSLLLLLTVIYTASAQTQNPQHKHHKKSDTNATAAPAQPPPDPTVDQTKQAEEFQKSFVPRDPWRVINDHTNFAKGAEWVQFEGRVDSVSKEGVEVQGTFGQPLFYLFPKNGGATSGKFVLINFPYPVSSGQILTRTDNLVAMKSGDKNGMPSLDYGSVYVPQLTDEQKAARASAKTKADEKVLEWHKELADKGDAYGEYKMGMRYLNGDGVDKDVTKAKDLLGKAAAQGNKDAADQLSKITSTN